MRKTIRMIVVIFVLLIFVIGCNYPKKFTYHTSENNDMQNISINDEKTNLQKLLKLTTAKTITQSKIASSILR